MIPADLIEAAVLLEIMELQRHGGPDPWQVEEAQRRLRAIRESNESEAMLFASNATPSVFRATAEALAVLVFCPGGVVFCGRRFEAPCISP